MSIFEDFFEILKAIPIGIGIMLIGFFLKFEFLISIGSLLTGLMICFSLLALAGSWGDYSERKNHPERFCKPDSKTSRTTVVKHLYWESDGKPYTFWTSRNPDEEKLQKISDSLLHLFEGMPRVKVYIVSKLPYETIPNAVGQGGNGAVWVLKSHYENHGEEAILHTIKHEAYP